MRYYSADVADHVVLHVKVFQIAQMEQILNSLQFTVVNSQDLDMNGHIVQFLEVDIQDSHVYELFHLRVLQIGGIFHNVAWRFGHFWLERIKRNILLNSYTINQTLIEILKQAKTLKLLYNSHLLYFINYSEVCCHSPTVQIKQLLMYFHKLLSYSIICKNGLIHQVCVLSLFSIVFSQYNTNCHLSNINNIYGIPQQAKQRLFSLLNNYIIRQNANKRNQLVFSLDFAFTYAHSHPFTEPCLDLLDLQSIICQIII
ncbi:Hypothetical_protein [Hexamita inflata]|uniref:Hypothetical_protein n=1 Tax=Hexamita inflata TaxID=28002 RepID=A0AA86TT44_9EUKA|nr:Hypothetical protein HINF_LOCUS15346 [Hexamita inflata]CAI9972577.1 Hypothetical protein HINF_LOCUS60222 [Hexamita inflata]